MAEQLYPTAEAYEAACKALWKWHDEAARLRAALTKYLPLAESHLLMIAHREDLSISADAKDRLRELQTLKNSLRGAVETKEHLHWCAIRIGKGCNCHSEAIEQRLAEKTTPEQR